MMAVDLPPKHSCEPVEVILSRLQSDDEVVRCAAARALAALGDQKAAPGLVKALLDEDPDVRTDAMFALVRCARTEDADSIRPSLLGDPVKEVKILAIEALGRLKDSASVPLLISLAKDRCDHDVAWEDEAGMWDDWLDVQLAAITALGDMAVQDAVQDLLEARDDEMGQELDDVLFATLAKIPEAGITTLLGLLHDSNASVRAQALAALSKAHKDLLLPRMELLLQDASPEVRQLALTCLEPQDPWVERLLRDDQSALVRRAVIERFAVVRPELARAALEDRVEDVRAVALEALLSDPDCAVSDDLAANVQAWMATAGPALAATCAKFLPRLCGAAAQGPLADIACDDDKPMELRITAIRALKDVATEDVVGLLTTTMADPTRQIRATALTSLAALAKSAEEAVAAAARATLVAAIQGKVVEADASETQEQSVETGMSVAAPKVEDLAGRRITITREGDILPVEDADAARTAESGAPGQEAESEKAESQSEEPVSNVIDVAFPQSTLAAIQTIATDDEDRIVSPRSGDAPNRASGKSGKRHRRVAVDGPDNFALDLRLVALRIAADCKGEEIAEALCGAAEATDPALRTAAYATLAQRSEVLPLSEDVLPVLEAGARDDSPLIRGSAAQAIGAWLIKAGLTKAGVTGADGIGAGSPGAGSSQAGAAKAVEALEALLDDSDGLVRATALRALASAPGERTFAALRDESAFVRQAAVEMVLTQGSSEDLSHAITILMEEGFSANLAEACRKTPEAGRLLVAALGGEQLSRKPVLTGLEAIAAS